LPRIEAINIWMVRTIVTSLLRHIFLWRLQKTNASQHDGQLQERIVQGCEYEDGLRQTRRWVRVGSSLWLRATSGGRKWHLHTCLTWLICFSAFLEKTLKFGGKQRGTNLPFAISRYDCRSHSVPTTWGYRWRHLGHRKYSGMQWRRREPNRPSCRARARWNHTKLRVST